MTMDKTEPSGLGRVETLADEAIHNKFVDAAIVGVGAVVALKTGAFGKVAECIMGAFPRSDALMAKVDGMLPESMGRTATDEKLLARLDGAGAGLRAKTPAGTPIDYPLKLRSTFSRGDATPGAWISGTSHDAKPPSVVAAEAAASAAAAVALTPTAGLPGSPRCALSLMFRRSSFIESALRKASS